MRVSHISGRALEADTRKMGQLHTSGLEAHRQEQRPGCCSQGSSASRQQCWGCTGRLARQFQRWSWLGTSSGRAGTRSWQVGLVGRTGLELATRTQGLAARGLKPPSRGPGRLTGLQGQMRSLCPT